MKVSNESFTKFHEVSQSFTKFQRFPQTVKKVEKSKNAYQEEDRIISAFDLLKCYAFLKVIFFSVIENNKFIRLLLVITLKIKNCNELANVLLIIVEAFSTLNSQNS